MAPPLFVTLGSSAARLIRDADWAVDHKYPDDKYPSDQNFADEFERLLQFADSHGALSHLRPRLCSRPQQRDEAINEMRTAFYFDSAGYRIVDWTEPADAVGYKVEFSIDLDLKQPAFVEVKSPGWEGELTDIERQSGRAKQPKFTPGKIEGRAAGPVPVIRRAVEKALPKFSGQFPSIVVISDDCFVNLGEWGWGPLQIALTRQTLSAYGSGLFHDPRFNNIGAVCLFRTYAEFGKPLEYRCLCQPNPNAAASCAVPQALATRLSTNP
jgi:hypothetical protein